jgi:CRP-like cAMP-binding protein
MSGSVLFRVPTRDKVHIIGSFLASRRLRVRNAPASTKGGDDMSRHLENQLLARLDRVTFAAMEPHLVKVNLERGKVLSGAHDLIATVYFPLNGIISCVVELIGGGAIETGMIGKDGQFGGGAALDHRVSLNVAVMQVAGEAFTMPGDHFRRLAHEHPALRDVAVCYEQFFLAQVQQTAACNAAHVVQQRTCKWLLRMHKLTGDELPLTQEFLAQMMGVRRTSVTEVAVGLQQDGMISYSRGRIHIRDLAKIHEVACECDDAVNAHYDRVFENSLPSSSDGLFNPGA